MTAVIDYMTIGICIFGYLYIVCKAWEWVFSLAFKGYEKTRKTSRRQKAVNDLYDAFELEKITDGQTVKITSKENLIIMMYRSGH